MIIGGFDHDGTPRLFKTEPSGVYFEFLSTSIGRNEQQVREYLEENYNEESTANELSLLKFVINALSQVVQTGAQNIEIAVMNKSNNEVKIVF